MSRGLVYRLQHPGIVNFPAFSATTRAECDALFIPTVSSPRVEGLHSACDVLHEPRRLKAMCDSHDLTPRIVDMLDMPLGLALACAVFAVVLAQCRARKKELPLPPGPRRLPLLGNALQMPGPSDRAWLTYAGWATRYGDVMYLEALGRPVLILSSARAVTELLCGRAATYSDRPELTMANLSGWKDAFATMRYGERFHRARRLTEGALNSSAVSQYAPVQAATTRMLLRKLLDTPEEFAAHFRWAVGRAILYISYGYDAKDGEDELIRMADAAMANFSAASAPEWAVDSFPWLRFLPSWLPGAGFLTRAKVWHDEADRMFQTPFNMVKSRLIGDEVPVEVPVSESLTANLLRDEDDGKPVPVDVETLVMYIVGSLYGGGADTSVSAMLSFALAMTLHPEVQHKAQADITGGARLPNFEDRPRLPYVDALVQEVYRWNPVAPLGLPHRCMVDDHYQGHRIPEGAIVFANIWQILHDEAVYPDPFAFNPERYLANDQRPKTNEQNVDPRTYAFGFGRRECPGRFLADSSIWLMIASILATFDIQKATDDQGEEITPDIDYTGGLISHPLPIRCSIKQRTGSEFIDADTSENRL